MNFFEYMARKEREHRAAGELESADRLKDALQRFQPEEPLGRSLSEVL